MNATPPLDSAAHNMQLPGHLRPPRDATRGVLVFIMLFTIPGAGLFGLAAIAMTFGAASRFPGSFADGSSMAIGAAAAAIHAILLVFVSWNLAYKISRSPMADLPVQFRPPGIMHACITVIAVLSIAAGAVLVQAEKSWAGMIALPLLTLLA